jgi:hypothetical protein
MFRISSQIPSATRTAGQITDQFKRFVFAARNAIPITIRMAPKTNEGLLETACGGGGAAGAGSPATAATGGLAAGGGG